MRYEENVSYNDVIKELESIGIEIDYERIDVKNLDEVCINPEEFEDQIRHH